MNNAKRVGGFCLLAAIWGTSWVAAGEIDGHCPPFRAAAIRYGSAAVLLLFYAVAKQKQIPSGRSVAAMLILGGTMVALPFVVLTLGARFVSAGTIAVLFSIMPSVLALVSTAGRNASVPRPAFYATLTGFGAMVLAMSGAFSFSTSHLAALAGVMVAIASVTASLAYAKRQLQDVSPLISAGVQLASASLLLFPLSLITERALPSRWTSESAGSLALLTILGSALALPLFYWLLQRTETYQLASFEWAQPIVAVMEGAILFHQRLPTSFYFGGAAVVASIAVLFLPVGREADPLSFHATAGET